MPDAVFDAPKSPLHQSQFAVFKQTSDSSFTEDSEKDEGTDEDGDIDNTEQGKDSGDYRDVRIAYVLEEEDEGDSANEEAEYLNPLV